MKATVTFTLTEAELGAILCEHFNRKREEKIQKGRISAHAATDYYDRPTGSHYFTFTGEVDAGETA